MRASRSLRELFDRLIRWWFIGFVFRVLLTQNALGFPVVQRVSEEFLGDMKKAQLGQPLSDADAMAHPDIPLSPEYYDLNKGFGLEMLNMQVVSETFDFVQLRALALEADYLASQLTTPLTSVKAAFKRLASAEYYRHRRALSSRARRKGS